MQKPDRKETQKRTEKPTGIYLRKRSKARSTKTSPVPVFWASLLAALLYLNNWATAKIFKYVDVNGVIHLSNAPSNPMYQEWEKAPESYKNRGKKSPRKDKITQVVELAARKYGVNSNLVKAIIKAESNFNPQAISPNGAMGLMQLMPETARLYRVKDPFDPSENIRGGVEHLDYLLNLYKHDLERVLAAYNAGEGRVEKYNGVPPFPETRDYINKVIYYYQNPGSLQSDLTGKHHKEERKARKIFRYVSPDSVVIFSNVHQ